MGRLEHINLFSADAEGFAALFVQLFDWRIRWSGPGNDGRTVVHVGNDDGYLSVVAADPREISSRPQRLRHIGVLVHDLEEVERRALAAGLKTFDHADYEPGRRFYFSAPDGVEVEVVSYAAASAWSDWPPAP